MLRGEIPLLVFDQCRAHALPLSLPRPRAMRLVALPRLARRFVRTPAQALESERPRLRGGERVGRGAVITPAGGSPLR